MSSLNLWDRIQPLLDSAEPPELGPGPRAGVTPLAKLRSQIASALGPGASSRRRGELVEATVLLWHDHHEPAHAIVQKLEDPDGSYVHGILHRREPDYGNARYWFRRVGTHPCLASLAEAAAQLLAAAKQHDLKASLLPGGVWEAMSFIDWCERLESEPDTDPRKALLRRIQRAEFEILLQYFCS